MLLMKKKNKMKLILIVNPNSGGGKGLRIQKKIQPLFDKSGISLKIINTEYAGHAKELAQTLDFSNFNGICPIGGDGTMHEVINGMMLREDKMKIPIGLITGGTGNSFMHDLDLVDPLESVKAIIKGKTQMIDIVDLRLKNKKLYIFNIIGWGLVTDAGITAEYLRWLGHSRYTLGAAIEVIKKKKRYARLILDDIVFEDDFLFIIACNTIHTGKGMMMAPRAILNDGLMDVVVVKDASRLELFNLLPKVFNGSHVSHPKLDYYQVKKFAIENSNNDILNIDGEINGITPFRSEVVPSAIEVFIR